MMSSDPRRLVQEDCAEAVAGGALELLEPLRGAGILVTGGTGFMGTWLTETVAHLNDHHGFGARVWLLCTRAESFSAQAAHLVGRRDVVVVERDVRNLVEIPAGASWIVHAAGSPDNRLHAWEWLVLPGGRVLKADAVDHHRGHDLVGCQDLAWDVAGAAVELSLDADGLGALCAAVERHKGHVPSPDVLRFHRQAYLAFQLGHHALAATSYDTSAPDEAARLRRAADHYAQLLRTELTGFGARAGRR